MNDNRFGFIGTLGLIGCIALFLLACRFLTILLWIVGIVVVGMVILIALVIYFTVTGAKEKNNPDSPTAVLSKARADLMELRRVQVKIRNREIMSLCRDITDTVDKILSVLKQKPQIISEARQFLHHYLPTLGKILKSYVQLEEGGSLTDELKNSTVTHLGEIKKAMEKQYNSLFDEDKLDLTVDMEALTLACKRDGLLDEEEGKSSASDPDRSIN